MRRFWIVATVAASLLPASPQGAQALQRLIDVRQIATDTLRDVAVAAAQARAPIGDAYARVALQPNSDTLVGLPTPADPLVSPEHLFARHCKSIG